MKEKKRLEALYDFAEVDEQSTDTEEEDGTAVSDKADEIRKLTYRIEDNTAEIMNYNSIIETSKKSMKEAKKEYSKAKKEYDNKSFGALVSDILVFVGLFFTVYFLIKWLGDKERAVFEIFLYVSIGFTLFALPGAVYKNYKLCPYKKRMKRAKDLIRDSKTWIEESERGMRLFEEETRNLKKQKKDMQ